MKNWSEVKIPDESQMPRKDLIFATAQWDTIFNTINPDKIKYKFRDIFFSIKEQFYHDQYMTKKQANFINVCLRCQQRPYTVSARSFRGLPRTVYQPNILKENFGK